MFVLFVKLYFQKLIGFTIGTQSRTFSILYHCERRRRDFFECVNQFPYGNPCFRAFQRPKNTVNPWKTLENTQKIKKKPKKISGLRPDLVKNKGGFSLEIPLMWLPPLQKLASEISNFQYSSVYFRQCFLKVLIPQIWGIRREAAKFWGNKFGEFAAEGGDFFGNTSGDYITIFGF